jgi:hypothetical protein
VKHSKSHARPLLAAALLALSPVLVACYNGPQAATTVQATQPTGNGVQVIAGDINVDNATVVFGPEGTNTATLLTRMYNSGQEQDTILGVTINGLPATITGDTSIAPNASVPFGYPADAQRINVVGDIPLSNFVPVQILFDRAGLIEMDVLTVLPTGFYADVTP